MAQYTKLPELGIERTDGKTKLTVENIKCGGCANTITKSLDDLSLEQINVDHENNTVSFKSPKDDELLLTTLNKLRGLGYPIVDTEEGLTALALKAKSFTSCAIGKMS